MRQIMPYEPPPPLFRRCPWSGPATTPRPRALQPPPIRSRKRGPASSLDLLVGLHVPPCQNGAALRLPIGALLLVTVFHLGEVESERFRWDIAARDAPVILEAGNQDVGQFELQVFQLCAARFSHHEVAFFDVRAVGAVQQ